MKKGTIQYNTTTISQSISYTQINLAKQIADIIAALGIDCNIQYDSCTIDIVTIMNGEPNNGLNRGIFRVFWSSNNTNKIKYLGVGAGHYDGYQINRGWSKELQMHEIADTLIKDKIYYTNYKSKLKTATA